MAIGKFFIKPVASGPGQAPSAFKAFHDKCLGCHRARQEGPVGCRDCHAQKFAGRFGIVEWDHREHSRKMGLACQECHHQDKEQREAQTRSCESCHRPAAVMGIQLRSIPSHSAQGKNAAGFNCEAVSDPQRRSDCGLCHPAMKPAAGPPSLEQAVHSKCRKCHDPSSPKKSPSLPAKCVDCHRADPSLLAGGTAGPVLWSHARHSEFSSSDMTCKSCHHKNYDPSRPPPACHSCHQSGSAKDPRSLNLAKASHKRCIGCHKEKKNGPTECRGCHSPRPDLNILESDFGGGKTRWSHLFHADAASISCRECHHNTMTRDGVPFTVCSSAVLCKAGAANPSACASCHSLDGKTSPNTLIPAPKLSEAVNACKECHVRMSIRPAP
jgi:hypothetical protein